MQNSSDLAHFEMKILIIFLHFHEKSNLSRAGRLMLTLEVENEACERLLSRLWWYKCHRGTLLREGTPTVSAFGKEVK